TRQHVTVALNGDGGDEAFAGYERYYAARLAGALDAIPAAVRVPALAAVAGAIPDSLDPRSPARRARRFLQAAALDPAERYLRWVGVFNAAQLGGLLARDFAHATQPAEDALLSNGTYSSDAALVAQLHDIAHYLP